MVGKAYTPLVGKVGVGKAYTPLVDEALEGRRFRVQGLG